MPALGAWFSPPHEKPRPACCPVTQVALLSQLTWNQHAGHVSEAVQPIPLWSSYPRTRDLLRQFISLTKREYNFRDAKDLGSWVQVNLGLSPVSPGACLASTDKLPRASLQNADAPGHLCARRHHRGREEGE